MFKMDFFEVQTSCKWLKKVVLAWEVSLNALEKVEEKLLWI